MSAETLNAQLLRKLECPICLKIYEPPIYLCINGHSVCGKCQTNLSECSICRAPGRPNLRSVQLEDVAALVIRPCANQQHGCELVFNMDDMTQHLPQCDHSFECHRCIVWKGSAINLKEHVRKEHPTAYFKFEPSGIFDMVTPRLANPADHDKTSFTLFEFNDDIFWLEDKYASLTRIFSRTLRIVSHKAEDALRYYYSMEFRCKDAKRKYKVFHQAEVLNEDAVTGEMDIVLPACMIASSEDGWTDFTFQISLSSE